MHYPNEKWFPIPEDDALPAGILDERLHAFYDPQQELSASDLVDLQSGNADRGVCAAVYPSVRPANGVHPDEYHRQPVCFQRHVRWQHRQRSARAGPVGSVRALCENRIIAESISLPAIPDEVLNRYPGVVEAIAKLEEEGFPILSYDASLGGNYPVICVVLFNPTNGTCFASFGAHPDFGVALERTVTELLQGRSLKDLDVFTAPTFDDEEVAEHTNLETHFIDSSGLISWDLFKQDADYPFVDWNFSGSTQEEFATLMSIFDKEDAEVYIADYEHLGVYACRIIVPGMSDIYPAEDLLLANNSMGAHLRDTLLALPGSEWEPEEYLALIEQLDDEGLDDFTRVRELLGIASGKDNAWHTLRVGELKSMLALAGGDLDQALIWTEWTQDFNASVLSPARSNYYRCLQTLLLLRRSLSAKRRNTIPRS